MTTMTEIIQGQIERITYHDEESGYGVFRVKVAGSNRPITVVGNFLNVSPGEVMSMEGSWSMHARYGQQFKVTHYESLKPATVAGIKKYLGSGLVKGIGPIMAERIVEQFGDKTLDIIDQQVERLTEIPGIGQYRVEQIRKAWDEQREIREVMVFLRGQNVSAAYATRIFKHYGKASLDVLRENPYRLAMDVSGIGFLTADKIARNLGFPIDSPFRAEAGVLYVLHQATDEGHVCLPDKMLVERAEKLLQIDSSKVEEAVGRMVENRQVAREEVPTGALGHFGSSSAVYLRGYHLAETQAAHRLTLLRTIVQLKRKINSEEVIVWLREKLPFKLAPLQEQAVKQVIENKLVVITGGPGTGKTTLIRAILTYHKQLSASVSLAAPTGRAAKRLSEATGHAASTIHRLLEFSPQLGGFQRNESRPLSADLIVVDEASMLDTLLMHYLLKAVPNHASLVLVGDVDQLPSVGPGNVLHDIIDSGTVPVVRLTEIFRQARQSQIIVNAHLVKQGNFPRTKTPSNLLQDFYFIEQSNPEEVHNLILRLCTRRIPERFGLDPMEDIQVLSPMHRGIVGTEQLNIALQQALNPETGTEGKNTRVLRRLDRVMQVRNNYDKDVFNGDMGRIIDIDSENQELKVSMDGRTVTYDFSELDELSLAYAISVHKAQGSEYQAVVLPLVMQHFMMLQRNLLYTAMTRARKLVVIVGDKKAMAMAIRNNQMKKRFTLLRERLIGSLN